ncbi:sigma-70 family RNA polymerase sigma factor [Herbaspirillum sp. alder98]|uniref:sigma-70 family RNA polymerase sigma factor n=1 Tax=Herbaspirillum sp. alder98 TaxID=2913096 RepID=UPI001CD822DE|nr:sigma-70 family RNA polymerase sigma factor [Herbaspirillum sp. alder98]MCA1326107.1 sigma-70 family RNA polymerase sigma factor [Herbaspirillum sp. alder98]
MILHHYNELVGFFSRAVSDRHTASDIVQECYARLLAMEARTALNDPRALLYRTGKNIVTDGARRKLAEARMLETLALIMPDEAPCVERQVCARQQLDRLLSRLQAMPRKRREAFILVRLYGLTHAQAAKQMQCSEAAIEKHIVRGVIDCIDLARLFADARP